MPDEGTPLTSIVDEFTCREGCPTCMGTGTVCEDHPDRPWGPTMSTPPDPPVEVAPDGGCWCGGAGMPCPGRGPTPGTPISENHRRSCHREHPGEGHGEWERRRRAALDRAQRGGGEGPGAVTDMEKVQALLTELGVVWTHCPYGTPDARGATQEVRVDQHGTFDQPDPAAPRNGGYGGFYTGFEFDADGTLIRMGGVGVSGGGWQGTPVGSDGVGTTQQIRDAHQALDQAGVRPGPLAHRVLEACGMLDRLAPGGGEPPPQPGVITIDLLVHDPTVSP